MPQINTNTLFDQQNPHSVMLSDGSHVTFWLSEHDPPDGTYSIRGQVLNDNTKIGPEFVVPGTEDTPIPGGSNQLEDWDDENSRTFTHHDTFYDQNAAEFDVAVLADGSIAIAFVDGNGLGSDGNDSAIAACRTDCRYKYWFGHADGTTDSRFRNGDAGRRRSVWPDYRSTPGGEVSRCSGRRRRQVPPTLFSAAEDYGLKVFDSAYNADASFNGGNGLQISFGSNEYGGAMTVMTDGSGNTTGYFVAGFDDGPNRIFYRVVNPDGSTAAQISASANQYVDEVSQLSNGNLVVAQPGWFNSGGASSGSFRILTYNNATETLSTNAIVSIGDVGAHSIDIETVNGGFWAAWTQPGTPDTIGYAFYDNNGNISPDGIRTLDSGETGFAGQIGQPSITVNSAGEVTITYSFDDDGSESGIAQGVICFCEGTLILTLDGLKKVDDIQRGDQVWTYDNGYQRVVWTSHSVMKDTLTDAPVRFEPGVLGLGVACQAPKSLSATSYLSEVRDLQANVERGGIASSQPSGS